VEGARCRDFIKVHITLSLSLFCLYVCVALEQNSRFSRRAHTEEAAGLSAGPRRDAPGAIRFFPLSSFYISGLTAELHKHEYFSCP